MIKRRLFYVPGLISLVGLPILLLTYNLEDRIQLNATRINIPSNDTTDTMRFTVSSITKAIQGKKIEEVYLGENFTGLEDEVLINRKLKFISREAERLQFTNDTSTVLKIKFGERSSFGDFMTVLNIAYLNHFKRFALNENEFYFIANDPPSDPPITYPNLADDIIEFDAPSYEGPSSWTILWLNVKYNLEDIWFSIKQNLIFSIAFVILILIPSLYRLYRKTSNYQKPS